VADQPAAERRSAARRPARPAGARWLFDWAGGLVWLAFDGEPALVRQAAEAAGGHAMLVRAPEAIRNAVPLQHPAPRASPRSKRGSAALSIPSACSRRAASWTRPMRTDFSPEQLADPARGRRGSDPQMRPLRFLHRDLPDLCAARRRARFPPRPHLPDPEHARAGGVPTREVVKHVDRCLSCLACMTTCPSGVNYMHLVDHARAYIERRYKRPLVERLMRTMLAALLPYPGRFRLALVLARLARPMAPLFNGMRWTKPFGRNARARPEREQRQSHLGHAASG